MMYLQTATHTDLGVRIISCKYFEINFIMLKLPLYSFFFVPVSRNPFFFGSVSLAVMLPPYSKSGAR